jgi:hypothetical protein
MLDLVNSLGYLFQTFRGKNKSHIHSPKCESPLADKPALIILDQLAPKPSQFPIPQAKVRPSSH